MKKKVIISLLVLVVLLLCFIPFRQQKTVKINTQYFITFQQLVKPENWKNWQPDLYKAWKKNPSQVHLIKHGWAFQILAPGMIFNIDNAEGFAFTIDKKIDGKNSIYTCIVLPNNLNRTTLITVVKNSSLIKWLYTFLSGNRNTSDIDYLKNYLEDARLYYGFDIRKTTVTDSNVVVIKKVVAAKNKIIEIAGIRSDLQKFIKKHRLKEVQPVIADIRKAGQDSLRIMIGIPVDKQTVSEGHVVFMHLPSHGRMLTGLFTGRYKDREKLYQAMRSYVTDHSLATPEDPYEKYLDNKIPVSDTSFVHLLVNYPIY